MYWWLWLIIALFFLGMAGKSFYEIKRGENISFSRRDAFGDL